MSEQSEANFHLARANPVSEAIRAALGEQDARTYNGHSCDSGLLALETAAQVRRLIAAELEAEFGVTNRAAHWLRRSADRPSKAVTE